MKKTIYAGALACALSVLSAKAKSQDVTPVIHVDNPPNRRTQAQKHYVVLVSLDGFRFDYAKKFGATHLLAMANEGVSTPDGMVTSYPSVTSLTVNLRPI